MAIDPERVPNMPAFRALLLLLIPLPAFAAGVPTVTESALMRGVALPFMHGDDRAGWTMQIDLTNEFVLEANANESIRLDGESLIIRLHRVAQMSADWQLGIVLPVIAQGGGFLDGTISDWHEFFGLPNAGRERRPEDEFVYRYERDGVVLMDETDPREGLGDLQVWSGHALGSATAKLAAKLPTGADGHLLGSGEWGAAAWLERPFDTGNWYGHLSGGASWSRAGGVLADQRRELLPIASASIGWRWSPALSFLGQVNGHGRAFDGSRLDALNRRGVQLVLGGHFVIGGTRFALVFQEDIVTASSPDFSLHLSWAPAN